MRSFFNEKSLSELSLKIILVDRVNRIEILWQQPTHIRPRDSSTHCWETRKTSFLPSIIYWRDSRHSPYNPLPFLTCGIWDTLGLEEVQGNIYTRFSGTTSRYVHFCTTCLPEKNCDHSLQGDCKVQPPRKRRIRLSKKGKLKTYTPL